MSVSAHTKSANCRTIVSFSFSALRSMTVGPPAESSKEAGRSKSLHRVLGQTTRVKELVEECAEELSSVNAGIKEELENLESASGIESALKKNERVEEKVKEASEKLTVVNGGLAGQVRDRSLLDHQFAAAVEQGAAARHAALHDALTDLPNRALFDDRLQHGLANAERHGWTMAVMFLDLDGFKKINDSHGHNVGDSVLRTMANRLKENIRSEDTVSRYGGDEFLFLLTEIQDNAHVALFAEKIVEAMREPCEVNVNDTSIFLSIKTSIGIALFPRDGSSAEMLLKIADAAMYRAKQNKSGYAFAN